MLVKYRLILEFSIPGNLIIKTLYLFYFRHILPRLGGLISGDKYAYHYLNRTVETFSYGEAFSQMIRNAGFQQIKFFKLNFGISMIYVGDKTNSE